MINMKFRLLMMSACVFLCGQAMGQRISFDKSTVNAGTTLWRRPVTAVFKFTNKEREPLVVTGVDAGCGCLDVKWTKGAIAKGAKGEIAITYDAKLLGRFDRYVNVHTNGSDKPERIRLKGLVSIGEKDNKNLENLFPYQIGDIMLSTDNIEFPDVHKGDSAMVSFEILNGSSEVYTPQLMHLPPYITAEYKPAMLGRGRRGVVNLTLNTENMNSVGINQTNIYLARFSGDKVGNDNDITLTSVLLPELEKSDNALLDPEFHVSSNVIEMGKLGRKSKISGKVTITNKGKGVLRLESIEVYNQALKVSLPKRSLVPGESMKMKVTLQAKYLGMSNAQPRVLIITNDADHQKETITVKFVK